MPIPQCLMSEGEVQEAFLAAPPLISEQIIDLTIKHPNWMRDLFEVGQWPTGHGTLMEQLIFRGAMPPIERGLGAWKDATNNTGCDPCEGPDCGYNWTQFGGYGLERKITKLMSREFRSPAYCVKEIQTTAQFEEIFAKLVENLYAQVDFFKEMNIGHNILTSLAKKYVVDSGGAKPNPGDPYSYRNIGTATLSALNIDMLEFFYEQMRRMPDAVPYDNVNGSPIFALLASSQLLSRLYRDDPNLRQDVRFSGLANALVEKYNFLSTIRGMFLPAPVLYPRRFNIVDGEPVEVLPFVNGIPVEVGVYTGQNPAYEMATHEEVLIHGKMPFKLFYQPTVTSLGANTSFGPEYEWFNTWLWVNPMTVLDPFRRVGYFATSATLGVSQQYSNAVFGILVSRPKVGLMAAYNPEPSCPPTPAACDNEVPDAGCPCPLILSYSDNPIDGSFFINLAVPIDVVATDEVQFGLANGNFVIGTVVDLSDDGKSVQVTFADEYGITCDKFISIFCDNTFGCSSDVLSYELDNNQDFINVVLKHPIKADVGEEITVYYGNGLSETWTVRSVDPFTNTYRIETTGEFFSDQVSGIVSVCVPTTTEATCPACGGPTFTQCAT